MTLEAKNFDFEVKAINDFEFEGYASVFKNIDSYRDVIEPGAFTKTIQESKRVKVLWQHDPWQPIGKPILMQEDSHGLYVKAKISKTERGKEAMQLMKDGVIDELSIGFNTVKDEWDHTNNVRRIKEVRLWEFSPVTFAANDQAGITAVKSAAGFERLLFTVNEELKAGKVLSGKNQDLVLKAIEALQALVQSAEGKGFEPPNGTQNTPSEEDQAAINAMIAEMKKFGSGF